MQETECLDVVVDECARERCPHADANGWCEREDQRTGAGDTASLTAG